MLWKEQHMPPLPLARNRDNTRSFLTRTRLSLLGSRPDWSRVRSHSGVIDAKLGVPAAINLFICSGPGGTTGWAPYLRKRYVTT